MAVMSALCAGEGAALCSAELNLTLSLAAGAKFKDTC